VSGLESDKRRSSHHRAEPACATTLRLMLSIPLILTFGAITPLADLPIVHLLAVQVGAPG